jgi:hypothetical protein
MYVHPQEVDYTLDSLFELIDQSGLEFVGFSNPQVWQIDRLLASDPDLLARARQLSLQDQCRLVELLDPEITHFEWFLARPPYAPVNWDNDVVLLGATPTRNPCMEGWPSQSIFDHNYQIVTLDADEFAVLQACDRAASDDPFTVADLLRQCPVSLDKVRQMQRQQLILLRSPQHQP